jgi:hypothetical protein
MLPQHAQGIAAPEVEFGGLGLDADGLVQEIERGGGLPDLLCQDGQQIQRLEVVWSRGEDLPVEGLRLVQAAGLVVGESLGELLLEAFRRAGLDVWTHHLGQDAATMWMWSGGRLAS